MIDIKKPTAFRITKEANDAGEEILKEPGNLGTISELAILGITLVIKSEDKIHQSIEWSTISKDSSGIGLSIVKKIIDLYQGEIWLESELNKGTSFHFTIKK